MSCLLISVPAHERIHANIFNMGAYHSVNEQASEPPVAEVAAQPVDEPAESAVATSESVPPAEATVAPAAAGEHVQAAPVGVA